MKHRPPLARTSISLTQKLRDAAQKRAAEIARGNFSAYIERLIERDLVENPETLLAEEPAPYRVGKPKGGVSGSAA